MLQDEMEALARELLAAKSGEVMEEGRAKIR